MSVSVVSASSISGASTPANGFITQSEYSDAASDSDVLPPSSNMSESGDDVSSLAASLDDLDMKSMASSPEKCDMMFQKILKKQGIDRHHISCDYSSVWARGTARFKCILCDKTWQSKWAWVETDILKQRVVHQYSQRCFDCWNQVQSRWPHRLRETEAKPQFLSFRSLLRNILDRYKELARNNGRYDPPPRSNSVISSTSSNDSRVRRPPPHTTFCCEACEWGRRKCWTQGPSGSAKERVVFIPDVVASKDND